MNCSCKDGQENEMIMRFGISFVFSFCFYILCSVQFSSVTQSCLNLCNPMNRSIPGLPVHHQLLEATQTYVHLVGYAIQPLLSLSPPGPNPSQH